LQTNLLHPDRLLPNDPQCRDIARRLYDQVKRAPIISPHGHVEPGWFALNQAFSNPVSLLLTPDHYLLRMLYSQGISLDDLGVERSGGNQSKADPRKIWRLFSENFHLFRATPSSLWLKHVFHEIFDLDRPLHAGTADYYFDTISAKLQAPDFKPRALFEKFQIEVLATTDRASDELDHHRQIKKEWPKARVIPTYRPDSSVDPEHEDFSASLKTLADQTSEDTESWAGYLNAHRKRRDYFKKHGATATDHGHPSAWTLRLSSAEGEKLFQAVRKQPVHPELAEKFRAHMLWQMAAMSLDDGLVMQFHPGSCRNHNPWLLRTYGRDKGADIPTAIEFTKPLQPLLESFGNDSRFRLILFTLDESTYSRELAPLAGHYPAIRLGAPWWFHDSPEGMKRQRRQVVETAGFYNLTGFIDDTRAFFSIPARHDVARRVDAGFLSELVCDHRLSEDEASDLILQLNGRLARESYRL
jgi:glucuronate isomerase